MTSAEFTINGESTESPVEVSANSTVEIALTDSPGIGVWQVAIVRASSGVDVLDVAATVVVDVVRGVATVRMPDNSGVTIELISAVNLGFGSAEAIARGIAFVPDGDDMAPLGATIDPMLVISRPAGLPSYTGDSEIDGDLGVTGGFHERAAAGWKDILGEVHVPGTGPTIPTLTTWGDYASPGFAIGDISHFQFHIPHDYSPSTGVFFHVHWHTSGTGTNAVRWRFTYSYAHGYARGVWAATGATVEVQQAATGVAHTHMITEIASAVLASSNMETDGVIKLKIERITNGGTDLSGVVLVEYVDVHYQARIGTTTNRNYPFE